MAVRSTWFDRLDNPRVSLDGYADPDNEVRFLNREADVALFLKPEELLEMARFILDVFEEEAQDESP